MLPTSKRSTANGLRDLVQRKGHHFIERGEVGPLNGKGRRERWARSGGRADLVHVRRGVCRRAWPNCRAQGHILTRAQRVPPRAENDPRGHSPWSDSQMRRSRYSVTGAVLQTEAKRVRSADVPPLYCTTDRGCYNLAYLKLATNPRN